MRRRTISARFQLLATEAGGRSGALLSGYRSLARFAGTDTDFGFELELDSALAADGVAPGAGGSGRLSFWAVDQLPGLLAGQNFELREGTQVVGHGVIVDPSLD
jgi:hypothetical protein